MIKEDIIEKLLGLSIVDVVSDHVELRKAGANYKGCCPFHQEKTPSFIVSPAKNICHCFGCGKGGNTISFVMEAEGCDFVQACKKLGESYKIPIEEVREKELTPEEVELQKKRESGWIIYNHLQQHFVECLHAETPEAKAAMAYAVARWGKEEVETRGLGYAPKDWQDIIRYAQEKGLSIELMKEMHLICTSEKGNDYGFYNDRLMIPVRDKFQRIVSYTARTMDEHKEKGQKYLNGAESFMFSKGDILFGLDTARLEGVRRGKFYIVEGGPDVIKMQEIGVVNTVAPLGTALTPSHLETLKKFRCSLCFIPDADYAGIEAVKKNGRLAMEKGFRVTVKEIPPTEEGKKQDADSYFQNSRQVEELKDEDYVIWLARHIYSDDQTDTARSDSVREICDVLVLEADKYTQDSLLDALVLQYSHKGMWKNALNGARKRKEQEKARHMARNTGIDLERYGFYESGNSYWSNTEEGAKQWSNFKMRPLFHIMGVNDAKRLYEVTNTENVTRLLEMDIEEMVALNKFRIKLESAGNFFWKAGPEEQMKLKQYLYDNTETAVRIRQYGWQKKGSFWAFGNGCIYNGEWFPADKMGIVRLHDAEPKLDNYYLQGASEIYADEIGYFTFEKKFIMPEYHSSATLPQVAEMIADVFGDNGKVGMCYLLASLFRDVITGYTSNFPLLNLFGPKGSGKSQLGITLTNFLCIGEEPTVLHNTTLPGLSQILAQATNGIVHLDEYKNTLDIRMIEVIKGAYDGMGRSRLDMDKGKQIEKTPVNCGVIVSGQEMPTLDIALFSRMVYLTHDHTIHTREEKERYNRLVDIRKMGLQYLTMQILSYRGRFEAAFYEVFNRVTNEILDRIDEQQVEDRIWRNWATLLAAYRVLQEPLQLPWAYAEMLDICVQGIERQMAEVISNNELGNLWNALAYLYEEGMVFTDADFKIKYRKTLKTDRIEREWQQSKPILMLRLSHFIGQYRRIAKLQGESVMSKESIRYYLTTSSSYLGIKASERWKVYQNGQPLKETVEEQGQYRPKQICKFDRCMCFDYDMLRSKFDLNLEQVPSAMADSREREEDEREAREFERSRQPELFDDEE